MIRSSVESRPMQIGGSNNAGVAGINLTSAELSQIFTTSGTLTIGDPAQTGNITFSTLAAATVTMPGVATNNISVTVGDATDYTVTPSGAPISYSPAGTAKFVYNGPSGAFSQLIFDDPSTNDAYSATQSLSSTKLVRSGGGVEFDANNVANLYIYASDPSSTATVIVGMGTENNYFVGCPAAATAILPILRWAFTAKCRAFPRNGDRLRRQHSKTVHVRLYLFHVTRHSGRRPRGQHVHGQRGHVEPENLRRSILSVRRTAQTT